ncbi:Y-family DNA polymerase [uncultured Limosilactobacillus sp.]|uniref:Y-family DNA polymerase n=1 Tax=uncultured Limosilactobacillus sp. TaxID=2837629 RepID=UPI0025D261FF|nr:Y-family DNA polymerase [uncultured Limosilactobacillus sp.]
MITQEEPAGVFAFIDNKSFYATVECTERGLDPLTTPLVVMSEAANTGSGLVLASSPMAKQLYHITNVNRRRDLPDDPNLIVVPPRMNLYIEKNMAVNQIFNEYVADEDLMPYSIDESLLDLTHSWRLFGNNLLEVIRKIQREVLEREQLVLTVGLGNNPIQAKIALDCYAKHNRELIGVITNHTVRSKIWRIKHLTDVWGINKRTEVRLNRLNIYSVDDLAHADPFYLKSQLGIIGTQLYATAWGIDRTQMTQTMHIRHQSIGNSQVLPRDYRQRDEIEVVLKEIGAQVAARLRAQNKQCQGIHLYVGYSMGVLDKNGQTGFAHSLKLPVSTAETNQINDQLIWLFEKYWDQHATIRHLGVACTRLSSRFGEQLDLFHPKVTQRMQLESTMDTLRHRFGKTAIVRASSLEKGATFIARSKLVGGHNGGQSLD